MVLGIKRLKRIPNQEKSSPLKESSSVNCGIATAENPELDPIDIDIKYTGSKQHTYKFIACMTNFYFHWSSMDSHVIFLILSIMTHLYIILITTRIKTIPTCRQNLFPWGSLDSFVDMIAFSLIFSQS